MQFNLGKGPQLVTLFVASQLSKPNLIDDDTLTQLNVVAHLASHKAAVDGLTIECTQSPLQVLWSRIFRRYLGNKRVPHTFSHQGTRGSSGGSGQHQQTRPDRQWYGGWGTV